MCVWIASTGHIEYTWARLSEPLVSLRILVTFAYFWLAVQDGSLTEKLLGNRLIVYAGMISYSLYLVHPYTYYIMRAVFAKMHLFTNDVLASMTLFILVTVAVTLPLTHIVHKLLEQWPYERFFRQRVYRSRTSDPAAGVLISARRSAALHVRQPTMKAASHAVEWRQPPARQ
jgi:peptidoglycan/LPS O-acetylase OafA/YrhL